MPWPFVDLTDLDSGSVLGAGRHPAQNHSYLVLGFLDRTSDTYRPCPVGYHNLGIYT